MTDLKTNNNTEEELAESTVLDHFIEKAVDSTRNIFEGVSEEQLKRFKDAFTHIALVEIVKGDVSPVSPASNSYKIYGFSGIGGRPSFNIQRALKISGISPDGKCPEDRSYNSETIFQTPELQEQSRAILKREPKDKFGNFVSIDALVEDAAKQTERIFPHIKPEQVSIFREVLEETVINEIMAISVNEDDPTPYGFAGNGKLLTPNLKHALKVSGISIDGELPKGQEYKTGLIIVNRTNQIQAQGLLDMNNAKKKTTDPTLTKK
ncbi:MAG: hypothetical protein PHD02_03695 [Bacilli bacterium]|nr:hypothetical protein [Bacilli bacterium]